MAIDGLTIIGESINDSVPSTHKLFEAEDIKGILELARLQDEKGASYIDVNVGPRSAEFMAELVRKIHSLMETESQAAPQFRRSLAYTRITAKAVHEQLAANTVTGTRLLSHR